MDGFDQAKKEISELSNELRRHQYRYYVEAKPEISDLQYERMIERLIDLESHFPELKMPEFPLPASR